MRHCNFDSRRSNTKNTMSTYLYLLFLVLLSANFGECGECCKAHYDLYGNEIDEKWCSNYCCFKLSKYDCCDNIVFQAPASEREDMCSAWVSDHVWVPIVSVICFVLMIIGCCVCCCKLCCGNRHSTVVVQPGVQPSPMVVQSVNSVTQSSFNAGYNQ